jgi:hypothetical protein
MGGVLSGGRVTPMTDTSSCRQMPLAVWRASALCRLKEPPACSTRSGGGSSASGTAGSRSRSCGGGSWSWCWRGQRVRRPSRAGRVQGTERHGFRKRTLRPTRHHPQRWWPTWFKPLMVSCGRDTAPATIQAPRDEGDEQAVAVRRLGRLAAHPQRHLHLERRSPAAGRQPSRPGRSSGQRCRPGRRVQVCAGTCRTTAEGADLSLLLPKSNRFLTLVSHVASTLRASCQSFHILVAFEMGRIAYADPPLALVSS